MADETIDWAKLREPFHPDHIEWRVGNHSKAGDRCTLLAYLTSRAVMDRLDAVLTPAGWRARYRETRLEQVEIDPKAKTPKDRRSIETGYICTLEILVGEAWVGKEDAADVTDIESIKGGISSSLKRAAVQWGIGRYLYDMPKSGFLPIKDGYPKDDSSDIFVMNKKDDKPGHVTPPKLDDEFLPVELRHKKKEPGPKGGSAPPKETDEEKAARQSTHDDRWEEEKAGFFRALGELGFKDYDEVVRFCLWRGRYDKGAGLRPSRAGTKGRTGLLAFLGSDKGADVYGEFLGFEETHGAFDIDKEYEYVRQPVEAKSSLKE